MFTSAYDKGLTPREFVDTMRRQNKLYVKFNILSGQLSIAKSRLLIFSLICNSILGIGHKIKSRNNPDLRVEILKDFAKLHFPSTKLLNYALAVESITTAKKDSLILNLDGAIAVCFVDLLRDSGAFTPDEAEEYMKIGALNGLFVLGRSIGFCGMY